MTTYFINDDGDNSDGLTWPTAFTSFKDAGAAGIFNGNNVVYVGNDHVCPATHTANLVLTGPSYGASSLVCKVISSTVVGTNTVAYTPSATDQIDTTEGAYSIHFAGCFALYGLCLKPGTYVDLLAGTDKPIFTQDLTVKPGAGQEAVAGSVSYSHIRMVNSLFDFTADGATPSTAEVNWFAGLACRYEIQGLTFVNLGIRTSKIFRTEKAMYEFSGVDLTGMNTSASIFRSGHLPFGYAMNFKVPSGANFQPGYNFQYNGGEFMTSGISSSATPGAMDYQTAYGRALSVPSNGIYRDGGATVEGQPIAWLITVQGNYNAGTEPFPFFTPYIYGYVSSAGAKTFSVFITNDGADFTDAEVWLEIEYLASAGSDLWTLATDHRVITDTPVAQDDDTTSTWAGSGPAFTYKQKLSVTVTVGRAGQYRARVAFGCGYRASSSYVYVDPKVWVS